MSSMVSGYSGILAPPNLTPNGNFAINQRGSFSSHQAIKVNDYISDMWYVHTDTNIGYAEIANYAGATTSAPRLDIRGYGKKGERVAIFNREPYSAPGYSMDGSQSVDITSSCEYYITPHQSVPLLCTTTPPRGGSHTNDWEGVIVRSGDSVKRSVSRSSSQTINNPASFTVTLQEDGEFRVIVGNFYSTLGNYKNPPRYVRTSYADDLARCQRYYQAHHLCSYSHFSAIDVSTFYNGNLGAAYTTATSRFNFPVTMAASPSLSLEWTSNNILEISSSSSVNHSSGPSRWDSASVVGSVDNAELMLRKSSVSSGIIKLSAGLKINAEVV